MKRSASVCVSLTVRFDAFSAGLEQEFERRINCAHAGKVVIAEIEAARGGHELERAVADVGLVRVRIGHVDAEARDVQMTRAASSAVDALYACHEISVTAHQPSSTRHLTQSRCWMSTITVSLVVNMILA
jgi:hypothetical protein